jgi:hypothetical protein
MSDIRPHLPTMTQLEFCMLLAATNGGDAEIDRSGRNLDLNQCSRYMPHSMRSYMNHRRRYLLPDGYSAVSDDFTRAPTGVFAVLRRKTSYNHLGVSSGLIPTRSAHPV